jgi:hypothetical protein
MGEAEDWQRFPGEKLIRAITEGAVLHSHPLKKVALDYAEKGQKVEDVAYVPTPVDGNKMYELRKERRGLTDRIGDAWYWKTGVTTKVALQGEATARRFACAGKHVCRRRDVCPYFKKYKVDNTEAFHKARGDAFT